MILLEAFVIVGTIATAASGALLGVRKQLDFFGVLMLSLTTAIGGGVLRDVLIGNTPPVAFREPIYMTISTITAIGVLVFYKFFLRWENILLFFDAIGLGAFTAIGANIALQQSNPSPFIAVTLGVVTGIGGGIIRDIFVQEIPLVFRKEIYALASIAGALVLVYARNLFSGGISVLICFIVTLVIRLLSIYYNLNLPVRKGNSKQLNQ